ncbi:MAG: xanthine dehydrogenase family protein molybdopterin-binding subunit, partial [Planctomycetaceae bacterium]|nr:xanthine dehydrogenase family protein molybdopterin-binding subunit [Planctomycetaceae bacterium]
MTVATTPYRVIGTRPVRHDGADKVTGKAVYTADFKLPGLQAGFILRSPHPHAKILSIDTSAAEATAGVSAVVTGADFPNVKNKIAHLGEGSVNLAHLSANCMAKDKVLYKGHAVAAVSATNAHIAEEAAAKIIVEYEMLPSVTDIIEAMATDAPLLHADLFTDDLGLKADTASNVAVHLHFEKGDVATGFEQADVVVEAEFKTATVHQGYIEPHAIVADYNEDGRVRLWTSTQGSFTCRQQTAEILQIGVGDVLVTPCEIGGGFGGKIAVYLEPTAAILSKKSGRPVSIRMPRTDVFEATGPTPASFMRVKVGAKNDGTLLAGEAWIAYDAGAFPSGVIGPGCMCVFSCYDIEHAVVDGYDVCVNKPHTKAYRAPGATQVAFAMEQLMDELAEQLDICPLEIRMKNAVKEGSRRVDGPVYPQIGFVECLEALRD